MLEDMGHFPDSVEEHGFLFLAIDSKLKTDRLRVQSLIVNVRHYSKVVSAHSRSPWALVFDVELELRITVELESNKEAHDTLVKVLVNIPCFCARKVLTEENAKINSNFKIFRRMHLCFCTSFAERRQRNVVANWTT